MASHLHTRNPPSSGPELYGVGPAFNYSNTILHGFNVFSVFYELKSSKVHNVPCRMILWCFSRTMALVAPGRQLLQDNIAISTSTEPPHSGKHLSRSSSPRIYFKCLLLNGNRLISLEKYIREMKKNPKARTEAKIDQGSGDQSSSPANMVASPMVQVGAPRGNNGEAVLV